MGYEPFLPYWGPGGAVPDAGDLVTVTGTSDNTAALTPVRVHSGVVDYREVITDEIAPRELTAHWQRRYEYRSRPTPWTPRQWDTLKGIVGTAALLAFYLRDWILGLVM